MSFIQNLLLSFWIIITLCAHAQTETPQITDTTAVLSLSQSSKYLDIVSTKAGKLEQKLDKHSVKALRQMQKLEGRIMVKLAGLDSNKAKEIVGDTEQQYKRLEQRLKQELPLQQYIGSLDSISTSLKFLQQNPHLLSNAKEIQYKLKEAISKLNGMRGQMQKAEEIKMFLRERKQFLREQLRNLGFAKELKKISKTSFYYAQHLSEVKTIIKDKRQAERKALELLARAKPFQKFFRNHSFLAGLFRLPGDPDDPVNVANLSGLQTRSSVNALIQNQISSAGPAGQQQFQQNIAQAQSQLSELKNKITQMGGGSSDEEMPEKFRVNNQRKKNFWKKWELGITAQSNKPNSFLPITTDLSLMAQFNPHDKYGIGVGIGGLIGWGKDIRHIDISAQGMKIRSFAEIKIKGSFHFAVGYELNYHSEIKRIEQLKNYNSLTRSGLAGISKIISVKSKFFKKAKMQLMWDFLSYSQIPKVNQPLVFRIGYNF